MSGVPWMPCTVRSFAVITIWLAGSIACSGDKAHSPSAHLPAYLLPQEPFLSAVQSVLAPPIDVCNITTVRDTLLQQLWASQKPPDTSSNAADFAAAFRLAHSATLWGVPSVQRLWPCQPQNTVSNATDCACGFKLAHDATLWGRPAAQVAAALARSAMNRTLAFPSAALNAMIHNPNPLDTDALGSQTEPLDPHFMHSFAWLDLTAGAQVLSLPDMGGRLYEVHLVDVYNEIPFISSLDSSGGRAPAGAFSYTITAQSDDDDEDSSATGLTFVSSSILLWAINKVYVRAGNATDLAAARALQQGITIGPATSNVTTPADPSPASPAKDLVRRTTAAFVQPYRLWGADRGPYISKGNFNPVDSPKPIYKNTSAFWELLGAVSALSPPQDPEQAALYASYSGIGLSTAGSGFDPNNLTDGAILGMEVGLVAGLACAAGTARLRQQATQTSTRWQPLSGTAAYGHDYLNRAVGAISALAMEPASLSVSYVSLAGTDRDEFGSGEALDGSLHNFTIAFPQAPEASAGWSLSAYNQAGTLFASPPISGSTSRRRFSTISSDSPGLNASSGSFSIHISATTPARDSLLHASWLPIGLEPFYLVLRLYLPSSSVQQGVYSPPPVYAYKGPPRDMTQIQDVTAMTAVLSISTRTAYSAERPHSAETAASAGKAASAVHAQSVNGSRATHEAHIAENAR